MPKQISSSRTPSRTSARTLCTAIAAAWLVVAGVVHAAENNPRFMTNHSAAAEVRVGQAFGDWRLECEAVSTHKTQCMLAQNHLTQDKKGIAKLMLQKVPSKADLQMVALLPPQIDAAAGVQLQIGTSPVLPMQLQPCNPRVCVATLELDASKLKFLAWSTEQTLTFSPKKGQPLPLKSPLNGLDKGMKALGW